MFLGLSRLECSEIHRDTEAKSYSYDHHYSYDNEVCNRPTVQISARHVTLKLFLISYAGAENYC